MDVTLKEIEKLEEALLAKVDAIKCAETRLESRTYRPGFELCRDEVELGLKDEVLQLRRTREDLIEKINCAKYVDDSVLIRFYFHYYGKFFTLSFSKHVVSEQRITAWNLCSSVSIKTWTINSIP